MGDIFFVSLRVIIYFLYFKIILTMKLICSKVFGQMGCVDNEFSKTVFKINVLW